jgi:putative transcriptional regulator
MSNEFFDSLKKGMEEAVAFSKGNTEGAVVHAIDVAAVRKKTGLTQEAFSRTYAIPLATLRKWERRDRYPTGTARVLLAVIDHDPDAVKAALAKRS